MHTHLTFFLDSFALSPSLTLTLSPHMVQPHSIPANLTAILKVYGLTKPPAHITVKQLFDKIISKVC